MYDKHMRKSGQSGSANVTILLIATIVLLVLSIGFGAWAYASMSDYKNNSDKKSAEAVAAAEAAQKTKLDAEYAEKEKSPNKVYVGPSAYGSVSFSYPKTWSGYVESTNTQTPVDGYFHLDIVPGVQSKVPYGLRVQVSSQPYDQVVMTYQQNIDKGSLKAAAYLPPKMAGNPNASAGLKFDGQLTENTTGSAVVLKLRDKTLLVWTEVPERVKDFNDIILASLTYSP